MDDGCATEAKGPGGVPAGGADSRRLASGAQVERMDGRFGPQIRDLADNTVKGWHGVILSLQ